MLKKIFLMFLSCFFDKGHTNTDHYWTLDHLHDVKYFVKKIRQNKYKVYNETKKPITFTFKGFEDPSTPLHEITKTINPHENCEFDENLTFVDFYMSTDEKSFINVVSNNNTYELKIEETPSFIEDLYGKEGFGFDINFLKDSPLHRTEHQIHPIYIKDDGIDSKFLETKQFHKIKKLISSFEKSSELQSKTSIFYKIKRKQEEWKDVILNFFSPRDEDHRIFLEDDEILYLSNVIRPYDSRNSHRKDKIFKNLLQAREDFKNAPLDKKEEAFQNLEIAKKGWQKWSKQYNGNVSTLEGRILRERGIDRKMYVNKLNQAFENHHPKKMLEFFKNNSIQEAQFKIPAKTHTLWFTHPDNPKEFPYIEELKRTASVCPKEQGFSHYLWVLNKDDIKKTEEALKGSDIQVVEVSSLGNYPLKSYVEDAVYKQRKMGLATDTFRAVLLNEQGGIYMDADFEALQSFTPFLKYYDSVFNLEPMSSFIGNAFMMTAPHHPIMEEYVKIIERNMVDSTRPSYINDVLREDPVYATICITGPGALTEAVASRLKENNHFDVVLPHPFFYPSANNVYPELEVNKHINLPFDGVSWGIHKWHTTWDKKEFGSEG